jgi:flagellar hook protein FlgE
MRLETALFTSTNGMDSHGQAISVIGDNISNSSTVGYKRSRVQFADLVPDQGNHPETTATIPSTGSGSTIQSITQVHETGLIENTGRGLDVAIAGNGFFLVGDAATPSYTRAGNFSINQEGILVNQDGLPVLGLQGEDAVEPAPLNMLEVDLTGSPTTTAAITGNLNSASELGTPPENPATFEELASEAAFVTSIDAYDSIGSRRGVTVFYYKTDNLTWTAQAYVDGADVGGEAGTPALIGQTENPIVFGTDGVIPEANAANAVINANAAWAGAAPAAFPIDMSTMTQFAATSQIANVTRDGQAAGAVENFRISQEGTVFAVLNTGSEIDAGTLILGTVGSPENLNRAGKGLFIDTAKSGERRTGRPGEGGLGTIEGSSLERSTVDISGEFVDLLLYQRGYQANSQVLNTANTMLKDTIQLMR